MKDTILHISNNNCSFDDRIFYKELISLSIHYNCYLLSGGKADGMLTTMGKELRPQGIYNNINVIAFPKTILLGTLKKLFPIIYNAAIFYSIIKICNGRSIRPSVLHYHDLGFSPIAKRLQKHFHCKLIFDCHEFYFSYFFEKKLNRISLRRASRCLLLLKKAALATDITISVTKNLDSIISLFNNEKNHVVIYNNSLLPAVNNGSLVENNKIVLVHEGSVKFNRGLKLMLELFNDSFLRENIRLKIVGDISGEEFQYFEKKVQEYNITNSMLELTGWINYEDLSGYLTGNIGIIFFEKAFNAFYSMPNKLFNYINAGLPILSTRCAESSDFITSNKIGVIVERDIVSVKEGLTELINNYDYYLNNIIAAQQFSNWKSEEKKLLSLYTELLKDNAQ